MDPFIRCIYVIESRVDPKTSMNCTTFRPVKTPPPPPRYKVKITLIHLSLLIELMHLNLKPPCTSPKNKILPILSLINKQTKYNNKLLVVTTVYKLKLSQQCRLKAN